MTPTLLDILADKNNSSKPDDMKRKHSNIYLYLQILCNTFKSMQ